ncbi:glycoside hydrolase family 12 protein [Phlegmacium glaucopus]|nr:glycoside hydrolase family 12 protein [Phlegmacium glaucopus]
MINEVPEVHILGMMVAKKFALLCLLPIIIATPLSVPNTLDTSSHCGQWESVTAGQYSLFLDQWGLSYASYGSNCATLTSLSNTTIAWNNTWTWVGNTGVKSFTNMQLNSGLNKQLSAIKSIPATWKWSQTSSGTVVADVAYDLFTSSTPGGGNVNEIMIWLANFNSGPISAVYSYDTPKPIATKISLAGHTWNLYSGSNGVNKVFSFLLSNGTSIKSFRGDLNVFIQHLTAHHNISTAQFLTTAQGGTEATSGSATFTTKAYSLVVN